MLKNASLKSKLLSAFAIIASFVILVAGAGYICMDNVYKDFTFIDKTVVHNLKRIQKIYNYSHESNRYLMRAYMARDEKNLKRLLKSANDNFDKFEAVRKEYMADTFSPGEKEKAEKFFIKWDEYMTYARTFESHVAKFEPAESEKAINLLDGRYREVRLEMYAELEALNEFHSKLGEDKSAAANAAFQSSRWINILSSVVCIIVAICMGFFISGSISKTIKSIALEIKKSAEQTAVASEELTNASAQLSQGATESAASLEETVSSLEELSSMVKLNSDHAKEANSLSQKSLYSAENGEKEIEKLISAMSEMEKSSKKIEEIINVIDDIAFQTNLLALNAAVEAARAGEQGKGFAVVADAVRNLASRSASAAKDINSLIKENVDRTNNGTQVAGSSGIALKEIVTSVKKVADLNAEISAASQEQANGIEQISKAMNHLDSAIQMNANSSQEVASAATEMSSQADFLNDQVGSLLGFVEGNSESVPQLNSHREEHSDIKIAS